MFAYQFIRNCEDDLTKLIAPSELALNAGIAEHIDVLVEVQQRCW